MGIQFPDISLTDLTPDEKMRSGRLRDRQSGVEGKGDSLAVPVGVHYRTHNETLPCLIVYPGLLLLMNRPDGDGAAICWLSLCSRTTSSSASLTFIIVYHITRRPVVFLRRLGLCSFGEDLGKLTVLCVNIQGVP